MSVKSYLNNSMRALAIFTLSLGILYTLLIYSFGQIFFYNKSNGSLLIKNGEIRGSYLLGQEFTSNKYFWPRPSSIDYNPMPSGASNLSLTSKILVGQYNKRKEDFIKKNGLLNEQPVPSEMLFTSASGVDPHISKEAAYLQVDRIVKARNLDPLQEKYLYHLIDSLSGQEQFNFTGSYFVNVLKLNEKLDETDK